MISERKIVASWPSGCKAKNYTSFVPCSKVFKFFFMIHALNVCVLSCVTIQYSTGDLLLATCNVY